MFSNYAVLTLFLNLQEFLCLFVSLTQLGFYEIDAIILRIELILRFF